MATPSIDIAAAFPRAMAIVIGRVPDNVSLDHFALSVAANPTAPLPSYFTVAGTQEFVAHRLLRT